MQVVRVLEQENGIEVPGEEEEVDYAYLWRVVRKIMHLHVGRALCKIVTSGSIMYKEFCIGQIKQIKIHKC